MIFFHIEQYEIKIDVALLSAKFKKNYVVLGE
jgi:hypothetical protein